MKKSLQFKSLVLLLCAFAWGGSMTVKAQNSETVTFSEKGYENGALVEVVAAENFTLTFDKGTNSNAPRYYNTGAAVRLYGGNTMTVSSENTITGVTITFGSGDGSNEITADCGTYENDSWTGESSEVVFTAGGTSGHRRLASVTVTFVAGDGKTKVAAIRGLTPTEVNLGSHGVFAADITYAEGVGEGQCEVTYVSSDESILAVGAGEYEAKTAGKVTVTVTVAPSAAIADDYAAVSKDFEVTVVDPNVLGGEGNPFTVAEALAFIATLGDNTSDYVYVKGIISQIDEVNLQYGNATYYISDDGTTDAHLEVYRGRYLDNAGFTEEDQIRVGDVVVVYGRLVNYHGNIPEFTTGSYITSITSGETPTVTISSVGWATYVPTQNVAFDDITAYIATSVTTTSVRLTEVRAVVAGTPLVVSGAPGTYELRVVSADECDDVSANLLRVSDGVSATAGVYVLACKDQGVGFYKWTGDASLSEGRVYLPALSDIGVLPIDDPTGITSLSGDTTSADGGVYSLSGVRVGKMTKGLYIKDGKKIMVK
ncbi:MAG: hypothetical protein J6M25_07570 [Prevotella sp.]|nr:hypothetical protein [Prevotella sp.]